MSISVGDIYCVFVEQMQKYAACQVTSIPDAASKKSQSLISIVELDWAGETLPDEAELRQMKPLYCDFFFWNNKLDHIYVEATIPKGYIWIGNLPPLITEKSKSYGTWHVGGSFYRQWQWNQIPADKRQQFKEAAKDDTLVQIGSETIRRSTIVIHQQTMRQIHDLSELAKLPCLTRIHTDEASDSLIAYIRSNPFVNELHLDNPSRRSLDLRDTNLKRLHLNAEGVESITLNKELNQLFLWGELSPNLHIGAEEAGRWLTVTFVDSPPLHCGLEQLGALSLHKVTHVDLLPIVQSYPGLRELRLSGKPGTIANMSSTSLLTQLRLFSTQDIFGFSPDEFPNPDHLPQLTALWMDSLPVEAAKSIKTRYKKETAKGLNMSITKPRKQDWLASNLENPFRDWDGRENISAATYKKTMALYKKMLTEFSVIEQEVSVTWTNEKLHEALSLLVKEFTETFNKLDKRTGFIETVEREEIYVVLDELLEPVNEKAAEVGLEVDVKRLFAVFNELRDF
ncbi:hypothetical protein [Brevibacillus reuszeri]